ncbi:DNA glycosylase [Pisolithus orientalis]|uniref:DNA glycosylase n=1 Tax=Pisolithus orientalis TaxID=936130 RepID=UPI0022241F82|nr:DNA glycosylase [Pisolithus orientalis]KAI6028651.1 DNA glycosylase [Pisolithus orientalis]
MAATIYPAGFRYLPLPTVQLSLAAVLNCGQSFRWTSLPLTSGHEYRLCLRDRVVCLRQSPDALFYRSVFPEGDLPHAETALREAETLTWIKDYFQLDVNLLKLYDDWSERDAVFRTLRSRFSGIRILRQDPWENLISFICSSNNNIAPPCPAVASAPTVATYHPFPPPSALAAPEVAAQLRSLGFGYRADFIQRTAKMLVDEHGTTVAAKSIEGPERWLLSLRDVDTNKAREELLKFVGVGRKVADCILLMSLDKREVIPVDTHVHQIAMKHYHFPRSSSKGKTTMTPKLYDEISKKLSDIWGEHAGWAHSILFTADLKAFSTYGLLEDQSRSAPEMVLGADPESGRFTKEPGPSLKRKRGNDTNGQAYSYLQDEGASLLERVKTRRRGVAVLA